MLALYMTHIFGVPTYREQRDLKNSVIEHEYAKTLNTSMRQTWSPFIFLRSYLKDKQQF